MSGTKIKICGLFRPVDASYVNAAMPDLAGFVFCEKSRRNVSAAEARALRGTISPKITTVGVFVDAPPEKIAALYKEGTIGLVQLHGGEDGAYIAALREMIPGAPVWKAYRIRSAADVDEAAGTPADRTLLDSGRGTGGRFDWDLAQGFPRPFILAGGLTPGNIGDAISKLRPYAVDLSSGVETDGVKDKDKILAAVAAARRS